MSGTFLPILSLLLGAPNTSDRIYARAEKSVFTIEVHTGNVDAKSTLGSGYLISHEGEILTNYHVISSYLDDPERFQVRIKNGEDVRPAKLVQFDLVNDLALLKGEGLKGEPLLIRPSKALAVGTSIVSLGNPHGLRLSIIEGLANGYAEKGLIDRMLLSMPLNSGMSGGPILNRQGEVIGTNVSVIWLSNSLSFGVPADKIEPLRAKKPLENSKEAYRQEAHRQLVDLEKVTLEKIRSSFEKDPRRAAVVIGDAHMKRLPGVFDCWDSSKRYRERGITKSLYSCNLQFTPTLGDIGEVASIEIYMEHLSTDRAPYGFYGYLSDQGEFYHQLPEEDSKDSDRSAPHCSVGRARVKEIGWKLNTCVSAYVDHPDFADYTLFAITTSRPKEAIALSIQIKGFQKGAFLELSRKFLEEVGFGKS